MSENHPGLEIDNVVENEQNATKERKVCADNHF
jgi:hypothetical protein